MKPPILYLEQFAGLDVTDDPIKGPYHREGRVIADNEGVHIALVYGNAGVPRVAAIADMLAAAPELFDALSDVLKMAEAWADGKHRGHLDWERCEAARAVLAWAKGCAISQGDDQ